MVRDLLALHFGIDADEVGQVEVVPVLDAALAEEVTQTRRGPRAGGKDPRRYDGSLPGAPSTGWTRC
jgi:hypothetical protein